MQQQLTKQAPEGFLLVGRIDAPERPKAAIVIVHGLCEHFGRYDYVTQRLLEAGYAVVRFDHRGHGRSMGKKVWYETARRSYPIPTCSSKKPARSSPTCRCS